MIAAALAFMALVILAAPAAHATVYTWDANGGTGGAWATAANWNPDTVPPIYVSDTTPALGTIVFGSAGVGSITLSTTTAVAEIDLNASGYTFAGSAGGFALLGTTIHQTAAGTNIATARPLLVRPGQSKIIVDTGGRLDLGTITASTIGGALDISGDGTITTTMSLYNNILQASGNAARITFNGTDWAAKATVGGVNNVIVALGTYGTSYTGVLPDGSTGNAGVVSANYTLAGSRTQIGTVLANTLKITSITDNNGVLNLAHS